jgi:hypothetical protein
MWKYYTNVASSKTRGVIIWDAAGSVTGYQRIVHANPRSVHWLKSVDTVNFLKSHKKANPDVHEDQSV